jgi:hypothetical protein
MDDERERGRRRPTRPIRTRSEHEGRAWSDSSWLSHWSLKRWPPVARPGARGRAARTETSADFVRFASSTCYVLLRDKFCPRVRASTHAAEALGRAARAAAGVPPTRQNAQRGPLAGSRPRHRSDTAGDADCGRADLRSQKATEQPTFADAADGSELTARAASSSAAIDNVVRSLRERAGQGEGSLVRRADGFQVQAAHSLVVIRLLAGAGPRGTPRAMRACEAAVELITRPRDSSVSGRRARGPASARRDPAGLAPRSPRATAPRVSHRLATAG